MKQQKPKDEPREGLDEWAESIVRALDRADFEALIAGYRAIGNNRRVDAESRRIARLRIKKLTEKRTQYG